MGFQGLGATNGCDVNLAIAQNQGPLGIRLFCGLYWSSVIWKPAIWKSIPQHLGSIHA